MDLKQLQSVLGIDQQLLESNPDTGQSAAAELRSTNPHDEARSVSEQLHEIEMARQLGYLLCKCTWPPQIMTLTGAEFIYRCPRCERVRDF